MPDETSEYAQEGTAAHELASRCLIAGRDAIDYLGEIIEEYEVTHEMAEPVQVYVDNIRQKQAVCGGYLLVEEEVEYSHLVTDGFGTSDAIILDTVNRELMVDDLKFGMGKTVYAEGNEQMMLYAAGASRLADLSGFEFDTVRMTIHQPRLQHISEHVITIAELRAFELEVIEAEAACSDPDAECVPGPSQCTWCKAKSVCRAHAESVLEAVCEDFEDLGALVIKSTDYLEPADLAAIFPQLDMVESFSRAVRTKIAQLLEAGVEVPGYKLVAGRRGARKWEDEAKAEELIRKQFHLKVDLAYTRKLISPTQAERVLGKRQWLKAVKMVVQPDGKPAVAPESDKREAIKPGASADEFDALD